jgi:hypothetical protein
VSLEQGYNRMHAAKDMMERFDRGERLSKSLEVSPSHNPNQTTASCSIELYTEVRLQEFHRENNKSIAEFFIAVNSDCSG